MVNVLVVGAGPSGLATAACLRRYGIEAELIDRHGVPGGAYRRIYRGVTLASPARYTELPGLAVAGRGEYITVPTYREYLERYAAHHALTVRRATLLGVERVGAQFRASVEGAVTRDYDAVVMATGMHDFPGWPQIPGLRPGPDVLHACQWPGPERFRGRRVLIVGGATGAVEIAEECARAGLRPVVSVRGNDVKIAPQRFLGRDIHDYVTRAFAWLPRRFLRAYCAGRLSLPGTDLGFRRFRRDGIIAVRGPVARMDRGVAVFADGTREMFDAVVAATGYRFETPALPAEVARAPVYGHPLADRGESRSWPNLFVVGMPCVHRLSSEFLYGIATDAEWVARRIAGRFRGRRV